MSLGSTTITEGVGTLERLAPLIAALPTAPEGEVLTPEQWNALLAICDVFVARIDNGISKQNNSVSALNYDDIVSQIESYVPEGVERADIQAYLQDSFSDIPNVKEIVRRKMIQFVPQSGREGLLFVLSALNTRAGSLLMTGSTAFIQDQDLTTRTAIVCNWAHSYLSLLRTLHSTFGNLARQVYLQHTTTLLKLLDFPATPKNIERGNTYGFQFHDFSSSSTPTTLSYDAIIIGSGCGAGVEASNLSRAGLRTVIIEKSYHFPSTYFPMISTEEHLFENGGGILSDDSSTFVKAGSTLGGGGTVNWSASLQPTRVVREEWSQTSSLPLFTSPAFQSCLDRVCDRMGVAKFNDPGALGKIKHSKPNQILLEGARRLGMSAITVPQNTGGRNHNCGYCSGGCPSCAKQGPANLWLPDAAKHGAEFIQGCFVEKILFSDTEHSKEKTATGVLCTWTSPDRNTTRTLTIKAPRIIVSAGTLHSPLILQRSGLSNPHIGKNLHLHPVSLLLATYPERTNPWEGAILTSAVTSLTTTMPLTPKNGPVIECLYSVPAYSCVFLPFHAQYSTKANPAGAAADYKLSCAKFSHSTAWVCIQRDIDSGSVYQDPNDKRMVRIKYSPSQRDRKGVLAAQIAAARIAYSMDAVEIDCVHPHVPRFVRSPSASEETNQEAFELWLQEVEKKGLVTNPTAAPMGSAHQMGTCRMAKTAEQGVVDGKGKVHGVSNVWVSDGSVLPGAPGVNPMVSIMGTSEWISRGIVEDWEAEKRS